MKKKTLQIVIIGVSIVVKNNIDYYSMLSVLKVMH